MVGRIIHFFAQISLILTLVITVDRSYVMRHPAMSCYTDEWNNSKHKAIAGCILYAIGIPVVVFTISIFHRKRLSDPTVVHRYGILFDLYRDNSWLVS